MRFFIAIFLLTGISSIAFSQNAGLRYSNPLEGKTIFEIKPQWGPAVRCLPMPAPFRLNKQLETLEALKIPLAFSQQELPLFCRWEYRMEKAARFPVKFRLGDILEVDRLEGKRLP